MMKMVKMKNDDDNDKDDHNSLDDDDGESTYSPSDGEQLIS